MSEIETIRQVGQLVFRVPAGANAEALQKAITAACVESLAALAATAAGDLEQLLTNPDDDEGVERFHAITLPDGRRVEITISVDLVTP